MFRYLSQPRWIWWHLLASVFLIGFSWLGWWQWRARIRLNSETGTPVVDWQNTFYAFQWWVFAVFVIWFWWKFLSDGYKLESAADK